MTHIFMSLMSQPIWRSFISNRDQSKRSHAASMHLPLNEADIIAAGYPSVTYRKALQHPSKDDPFWHAIDYRADLAAISIPVYLISGWHDIFLLDLLDDYARLVEAGNGPHLTIGPWSHLSAEAGFACVREGLRWYDIHLKKEPYVQDLPVCIYIMGSNKWQEMECWPPTQQEQQYYLREQKQLSMQAPQEGERPDHYVYDPADPTPAIGGVLLSFDAGQQDNRVLEERSDVLCYTTESLASDLTIIGTIRLALYVHSTASHTDFCGRLCDVSPEGLSLNVCDGILRLKPGDGEVQPDGSRRIELALWPTAYCFRAGHRLRLLITSGAHPRWARNLGTGEPIATATKMVKAEQTLYHDKLRPSMMLLPVNNLEM